MTGFELYIFVVCLIVYIILTAFSVSIVCVFMRMSTKLIRMGGEDERILKEDEKKKAHPVARRVEKVVDGIFSAILFAVVAVLFVGSVFVKHEKNAFFEDIPMPMTVMTNSMETKNKSNKYLFQHDLNDQFGAKDIILLYKVPDEFEIELYDIIAYELEGKLFVHRVIGIEEPNEEHPGIRLFGLQGDAVKSPDPIVKYSQMKGIYRGEKLPYVGSIVEFMQSPAGYICLILVVVYIIATPILENKLKKETQARLAIIRGVDDSSDADKDEGVKDSENVD